MPDANPIMTNAAPQANATPIPQLPVVNVVPPMGSTAPSFGSVLQHFISGTNPNNLFEKGVQTAASGDLQENRLRIAADIGKAMRSGDLKQLHKLQQEYDDLTAQLRSRAVLASHPGPGAVAGQMPPLLPMPHPEGQPSNSALTNTLPLNQPAASAALNQAAPPSVPLQNPLTQNAPAIQTTPAAPAQQQPAQTVPPLVHLQMPPMQQQTSPAVPSSTTLQQGSVVPPMGSGEQTAAKPVVPPMQSPAAQSAQPAQTTPAPAPALQQTSQATTPAVQPIALEPASNPKAGLSPTPAVASSDEKTAQNPFGVPDNVWEKVCQDQQTQTALLSMPKEAVELYKQFTPQEKAQLADQLSKQTHVFFFTVDNKKAFIDGKVMGRDAFQYMADAIDKQVDDGKISLEESMRAKSALNILKGLTPDQREGIVALVDAEVPPGASKN